MAITLTQPNANKSEVYNGSNSIQITATGTTTYNQMLALVGKDSAPKTAVNTVYGTNSLSYKHTISAAGAYKIQVIGTNSSGGEESVERIVTLVQASIGNKPPSNTMEKGATRTLSKSVTPSNAQISWDSSNTSVATVNSSGLVTAVNTGTATINIRINATTMILDSFSLAVTLGTTSKTLTMPQKYSNKGESTTAYTNYDPWVQRAGCSISSAINTSAYYNNRTYTLAQVTSTTGIYRPSNLQTMYWAGMPNLNYRRTTPDSIPTNYLSFIKGEIDKNRPVILYSKGIKPGTSTQYEHWVVAYGYTNNAATENDILDIDSSNGCAGDDLTTKAVERTLSGSWTYNYNQYLGGIISTSKSTETPTTW